MLFRLDSFDGSTGAWFEDMKTGLGLGLGHHSAWKRSAIVTDVEWLAKAFALFAWMTPGEVEVFDATGWRTPGAGSRLSESAAGEPVPPGSGSRRRTS